MKQAKYFLIIIYVTLLLFTKLVLASEPLFIIELTFAIGYIFGLFLTSLERDLT